MANAINWFEIPAVDLQRASKFYSAIFDREIPVSDFDGLQMVLLGGPDTEGVSGALIAHPNYYFPSDQKGPLLYLNGGEDLQMVLDRVEAAGGKISIAKRQISPEMGFMAVFIDSEGNRLALHSPG